MTPGARLQSAIDILGELEADARPADRFMRAWFRERRFVGAKDRRTIQRRVYTVLRSRARLDWWCIRHLGIDAVNNRRRVLASLVLTDGLDEAAIDPLFDGGQYRPAPLDPSERTLVMALSGHLLDSAEQPEPVRAEYPTWLDDALRGAFDGTVVAEMRALNQSAPLDLRVNTLKSDRAATLARLADEGIAAEPAGLSPIGVRIAEGARLDQIDLYRDGFVEIQDEGSQIVSLLTDARPSMTVIDYCAGAGGKTLALAAAMAGQGRLIACDADRARLRQMDQRLMRAGLSGFVETRVIGQDNLEDLDGIADRVLIDVPCSTSGAWRRDPAAKWRLTPADLDRYEALQRRIMGQASSLVRVGGRLVYATCSILMREDERQAEWFLDQHRSFSTIPVDQIWPGTLGSASNSLGPYLRLSPARSGTDGYFVAIFSRVS